MNATVRDVIAFRRGIQWRCMAAVNRHLLPQIPDEAGFRVQQMPVPVAGNERGVKPVR